MAGWALITGASSGIGKELCSRFARDGHSLVLTARSRDALIASAGSLREAYRVQVEIIPMDLSLPGSAQALAEAVRAKGIAIDFLVNNAGFGAHAPFAEMPVETERQMLQLNILSLMELTRLFLPGMLARRMGRILNVGFTASFQPGPFMAVYYASKAFVLSFSEALGEELRNTGVIVTALCPGPTRSGFQKRAGVENTLPVRLGLMEAGPVAEAGYRALMRGARLEVPGAMNKISVSLLRLSPRGLVVRAVRFLHQWGNDSEA